MKIISADERLQEKRGAKILLVGPTGVGKTSLLRTLPDLDRVLFVDIEAGDLAVIDLAVRTIRIDDWSTARNLAVRVGGSNPSFPPTAAYSQAHFDAVGGWFEGLDGIDTIFVDSLTALSRLSFRHAEQQPEAFSERTGKKDLRGAYGLHGREVILWLNQLQHARTINVVFVGILEFAIDDANRWRLAVAGGGRQDVSGSAGHRRRDHLVFISGFWRRAARTTRLRLHFTQSLELSSQGSIGTT